MTQQWKLVPVAEPTPEMRDAFARVFHDNEQAYTFGPAVVAMLEASPTPPASAQDDAKDERQAFEAWSKRANQGYDLTPNVSGRMATYESNTTEHAYRGFFHGMNAPAAGDALDAARWRAFIGCARIRPLGSAGLEQPDPNNYAHMGLEIWTVYGRDYSPELLTKMDAENERGRRWLVMFADVARAALAAQVPHKGDAA